jgi:hypothetical protein
MHEVELIADAMHGMRAVEAFLGRLKQSWKLLHGFVPSSL